MSAIPLFESWYSSMEARKSTQKYSNFADTPPAPDFPARASIDEIVALSERLLPIALKNPRFEQDRLEGKCREPFSL